MYVQFIFTCLAIYCANCQFMSDITVISANCQGLHDFLKRKDVLHYYKQLQCKFCLCRTPILLVIWKMNGNEWGYEVYSNSYSSKSEGVVVFKTITLKLKCIKKCLMKQVIYYL